jgi:hypothetical protein
MVADKLFAVTALEDEMPLIAEPLLIAALPNANALPVVPEGAVPEPRIDRCNGCACPIVAATGRREELGDRGVTVA